MIFWIYIFGNRSENQNQMNKYEVAALAKEEAELKKNRSKHKGLRVFEIDL